MTDANEFSLMSSIGIRTNAVLVSALFTNSLWKLAHCRYPVPNYVGNAISKGRSWVDDSMET